MYWSCLPIGSPSRSISMWQACSASSSGWTRWRLWACSVFSSAVVKLPEEPSPVPAGMSAMEVSSSRLPSIFMKAIASRMIGWVSSAASGTRSSFEYFTMRSSTKGLVQGDVDVAVDRGRDQEAAELAIIGRQVGAAAAERDAERASDDDHARSPR